MKGKKDINVITTGSEKAKLTALFGVTAANTRLPLLVILKGNRVPAFVKNMEDETLKIYSNDSAWMTEEIFLDWIDKIWKPHSSRFERSLLVMDMFRAHKTQLVMTKLEECRTDVLIIPVGLTYYCQPVDVYINKSVKQRVRQLWQDYMTTQQQNNPSI